VKVAVIINPIAGFRGGAERARQRAELAMTLLSSLDIEPEVIVTERAGHAHELARRALDRGTRVVCAWGGDGTVNEVGRALAFTPASLVIVPAGSGNGLAHALRLPQDPVAALRRSVEGTDRVIDAGELDGHLFFNLAGIGFDAHVAAAFNRTRGPRGFWRYVRVVLRELMRYEAKRYEITVNGETIACQAYLLSLANGQQWGNGAEIAPQAEVDDGLLDLVMVPGMPVHRLVREIRHLFDGTAPQVRGLVGRRFSSVCIRGTEPIAAHLDGEIVLGSSTVTARVMPGLLRVRV
jgi:diacylglycerol kinase (ATP)